MSMGRSRAIVRSAVAPLFAEPRVSSVQISQLLAGHEVELLEERDAWWCVRGVDRYEGWMHGGYLHAHGLTDASGRERLSLGCVVVRGGVRQALPLGAYLSDADHVASGETIGVEQQRERFPRAAAAITRTARCYFEGTSYLWGGVTPWGADCSGLVQSVYALHGCPLPRDAWQQASQGEPGDTDPLAAREGDLLFFSDRTDRHVTHVAIALGGGGIVHLALGRGGYAIEDLTSRDDPYVGALLERFVGARRVIQGRPRSGEQPGQSGA
jgi:gamma-D-glutamyl-L-lysine dipeptidyl-peptidase